MVTIAAENFMVGLWDGTHPLDMTTTEGTDAAMLHLLLKLGSARKAEESGQETFHMRVFDDVRTRSYV